jgi:CRP-like cAMP-binding protein
MLKMAGIMASRRAKAPRRPPRFDLQGFLDSEDSRTITKFAKSSIIFSQGDAAAQVMYLQVGSVKLSVLSKTGKGAIVAMLSPGDFFGEGCLAGQERRMSTATAMSMTTVLVVEKATMMLMLHTQPTLSDRFIVHMLARNIRIEEDLVDQLFNSSEKRLARATARKTSRRGCRSSRRRYSPRWWAPRDRVNFFMNKFRELGFIEYNATSRLTARCSPSFFTTDSSLTKSCSLPNSAFS